MGLAAITALLLALPVCSPREIVLSDIVHEMMSLLWLDVPTLS